MARITFSPLVTAASGSTGPVVFSRWKGQAYVRSRVTPANPQSEDQTTQRNYLSKVVAWWHDVKATLKDHITPLVAGEKLSEFNAFCKRNVKDLADAADPRIIPLNTPVNPIEDLAASTGSGSGEIDLTWSQASAAAADTILVLAERTDTPAGQSGILVHEPDPAVNPDDEALTVDGLDANTEYDVYVLVLDSSGTGCSIAAMDTATSGTA